MQIIGFNSRQPQVDMQIRTWKLKVFTTDSDNFISEEKIVWFHVQNQMIPGRETK